METPTQSGDQSGTISTKSSEPKTAWWKFDDDSVSEMKDGIISLMGKDQMNDQEKASSASIKSSPTGVVSHSEDSVGLGDSIVSRNAYLLVYRQHDAKLDGPQLEPDISMWLESSRVELEQEFASRCAKYEETKSEVERVITSRRLEVRQLIEEAADRSDQRQSVNDSITCTSFTEDPGRFVYAPWLQAWADGINAENIPEELNNRRLLCEHGKLDPSRWTSMKRLPTHVWHHLAQSCKLIGPELAPRDVCYTCLSSILSDVSSAQDFEEAREHNVKLAAEVLEGASELSEDYIVSRPWLMAWVRRQGRGMGTTSPTSALMCPHSKVTPTLSAAKSRQVAIPAELWVYLKTAWKLSQSQKAKTLKKGNQKAGPLGDDVIDLVDEPQQEGALSKDEDEELVEFPTAVSVCHECLETLNVTAAKKSGQQLRKESERAHLAHLIDPGNTLIASLRLNQPYCLVPRSFMEHWRSYVATSTVLEPPDLKEYMTRSTLCECHAAPAHAPLLAYPPPTVIQQRGRWVVDDRNRHSGDRKGGDQDDSSYFELIAPEDWNVFIELYCPELKELRILDNPVDGLLLSGVRATLLPVEHDGNLATFVTEPAVCLDAVEERRQAQRQARLVYSDAEVIVEVVDTDEDALSRSKASKAAQGPLGLPYERKSKRARKGRAPVTVDSSLLVSDFLLRVFQALGVHPRNARVFVGGRRLIDSDVEATLAQCEIFPGEEIFIVDSGEHDPDDLSGLFGASATPAGNSKENGRREGFGGTILSGLG